LLEKRRAVTKQTSSGGWGEREESFANVLLLKYRSIVRWEGKVRGRGGRVELFESLKSFWGFGGDGCSNKHLERLTDVANSQCTNYSFLECMTVTDERGRL